MDLLAKIKAKEPGFEQIHFLEVMACPGGCVAGAGTNIPIPQATKEVAKFKQSASREFPTPDCNQDNI